MWDDNNEFDLRKLITRKSIKTPAWVDWNVEAFGIDCCLAKEWDKSKLCAMCFSSSILVDE